MYGRVTKVLDWIIPIIQTGECGYWAAYLRTVEKNKKPKNRKRYGYGY